jgi:D,D-heptose 1,7-bisphosphate phosphatase
MNKAVFLDRDGTIIVDKGYLSDPEGVELIPGAIDGLKMLSEADFLLVVVSNQSGVERGYFGAGDVEKVDARFKSILSDNGVNLAGTYYCIHGDDETCSCRKPEPMLALLAADEHDIDVGGSFVVGDKTSDVMLAKNLGCRSVLVMTGMAGSDGRFDADPDSMAADLLEAARVITRG